MGVTERKSAFKAHGDDNQEEDTYRLFRKPLSQSSPYTESPRHRTSSIFIQRTTVRRSVRIVSPTCSRRKYDPLAQQVVYVQTHRLGAAFGDHVPHRSALARGIGEGRRKPNLRARPSAHIHRGREFRCAVDIRLLETVRGALSREGEHVVEADGSFSRA